MTYKSLKNSLKIQLNKQTKPNKIKHMSLFNVISGYVSNWFTYVDKIHKKEREERKEEGKKRQRQDLEIGLLTI